MRKDMGKVITERPRRGSKYSGSKKYGVSVRWDGHDGNYDNQPKRAKVSARGQYGWDIKEFTDVLGPVHGFIRKNVGRPWDKIYSEICAVLDKRKLTHKHVIDHIFGWVEKDVVFCPDGYWRCTNRMSMGIGDDGKVYYTGYEPEFIVHPKTGLLKANKARESKKQRLDRWRSKQKDAEVVEIDEKSCYRKIGGIWYCCVIKEASKHELELYQWVASREHSDHKSNVFYMGRKQYYVESKRQLNKKELKKLRERLK